MNTHQIPNKPRHKLSRADIARGLDNVPIAQVLIGAANTKLTKLTPKQQRFAQALALGDTKAGAYRAAYDTHTKPAYQSNEGIRLAAHPSISHQVDALRLAAEAREYATPQALRQLVIERLTAHAIDDTIQPAQRLRALELLGKITEVAAFTERREIVRVTDSGDARERMLKSLREVLQASAVDVTPTEIAPGLTPVSLGGSSLTPVSLGGSSLTPVSLAVFPQDPEPAGEHPPPPGPLDVPLDPPQSLT